MFSTKMAPSSPTKHGWHNLNLRKIFLSFQGIYICQSIQIPDFISPGDYKAKTNILQYYAEIVY